MEPGDIAAISAALIAFIGVLLTLAVSEKRARKESHTSREDAYRADVRTKLGELIVIAHTYEKYGIALSDPSGWLSGGEDQVVDLSRQMDKARIDLERALVVAELIAIDSAVQDCLSDLRAAAKAVDDVVREVVRSFWERRAPNDVVRQRNERWAAYRSTCTTLQSVARESLRPTVRDIGRRRRA